MKIRLVEAKFFQEDGQVDRQTDMTKLIAAFRNFWNAPKKVNVLLYRIKNRGQT
jgi:hypothetical protein